MVTFAYLTGWRARSEVITLQRRRADLGAGIVWLEPGPTKNREGRTIRFDALPELKALLEAQRAHTDAIEQAKGTIIPWCFTVTASRSSSSVDPG